MSEKRFYRASVCGDEGLYDKEYGCIIVNVRSNIDLDDNWNVVVEKLNELSEENEQLNQLLNEAEDLIESRLAEHFAKQYFKDKKESIGEWENE